MILRGLATDAGSLVDRAVNENVIRLAVTGLSRAGKTVFITSLIENLLALARQKDTLPKLSQRLSKRGTSRLRDATILPAGISALPHFDQAANLNGLSAAEPAWPERTTHLAQISLLLTLTRRSFIGQRLGDRRVRLDILDYPGEWLLDLPLLSLTYAQWSEQTLALLRQSPRCETSADFLTFLTNRRPGDQDSDGLARQGHRLYKAAIEACCAQYGLRYLQPGRFLCPGPMGDVPLLWFFPTDVRHPLVLLPGSLMKLLNDRFEAYKRDMRATFFDTHFRAFDRQVLLVDVLGALHAGRAAFHDTARAIQDITTALRYGSHTSLIADRLAGSRIKRVVFVATKADHVPALLRDNLRYLLRSLSGEVESRQNAAGAAVSYQVAASICSTEDGSATLDGRSVHVVKGRILGEDKVRPFHVGMVPTSMPPDDFWSERFFELPRFRPPPIDPTPGSGLRHIGLDVVLDDLLGDLL